jgi:hypothetical protein
MWELDIGGCPCHLSNFSSVIEGVRDFILYYFNIFKGISFFNI